LHEKCYLCPINRHISIQLRPKSMISALYSVIFYDMALSHKTYWLISLWNVIRTRMRQMNQSLRR
jgi:hypothetical protein